MFTVNQISSVSAKKTIFYFIHSSRSISYFYLLTKESQKKRKLKIITILNISSHFESKEKDTVFRLKKKKSQSVTHRRPRKDVDRHRLKPFRQQNGYDPRRRCGDIHHGDPGS
ncbi:hypothetical protein V8G54_015385 [Vigna mungo]|uniref:Uncharacterized protein n=1 Tax=Vigna mungo TaxID=3915 RepID=A0AAQ3NL23_VIGMU